MTERELDALVDHALIQTAADQLTAAKARLVAVRVNHDAAGVAHDAAKAAAQAAIDGNGTDPHEATAALSAAAQTHDVCGRIVAAAGRSVAQADADALTAHGAAFRPVYMEGVRRRLAAAAKADQARAALVEAEADYVSATGILNHATQNGCQHVIFDPAHSAPMTDHAGEIRRWSVNHHNAWWPGLDEAGDVRS